jgi:hypothetical protein
LPNQISPTLITFALTQRDRHVDRQHHVLDRFVPTAENSVQTAGSDRQENVVHRRAVRLRDLLNQIQGAADEGEVAI